MEAVPAQKEYGKAFLILTVHFLIFLAISYGEREFRNIEYRFSTLSIRKISLIQTEMELII
jgi:hypothetical protein